MLHFYTPPENIRKPEDFWYFQRVQKWNFGWKWVNQPFSGKWSHFISPQNTREAFGRSQGASNKAIGQKWAKPLKEWNRPYLNEIPLRVHLWFE